MRSEAARVNTWPPSRFVVGWVKPHHPPRIAFGRHRDVIRWHQIIPRLNPASPIALGAALANATLAHQINLAVPLPIARTDGAKRIKIADARAKGDAIKRVGIVRAGTQGDALGVGHGGALSRLGHIRNLALETDAQHGHHLEQGFQGIPPEFLASAAKRYEWQFLAIYSMLQCSESHKSHTPYSLYKIKPPIAAPQHGRIPAVAGEGGAGQMVHAPDYGARGGV